MQSTPKHLNPSYFPLLLFITCIAAHAGILNHSFMLDDSFFLNEKETLKLYPHAIDFFTRNQSTHYIPLNFLLNVSLFHIIKAPWPLYLLNIVLFYVNCLLLFIFVNLISKNPATAFLTIAIFAVHPMSGEILQHITFNIILIQFALIMISLITLYKYFETRQQHISFYITSLLTLCCALLCQETSLLFPIYAAALLFFLTKIPASKILQTIIPYIFLNILLICLWLISAGHTAHIAQNIQSFHLTFFDWSSNFVRLTTWYIKNLFIPQNIVFEYNLTPVAHLTCLWNLAFGGVLTGCIVLIFCYFKRSIESFALAIFLTGFIYAAPACLTHPDIGLVFEPHWLYFSSIGFCLFIALMLVKLKKHVHRWLYAALVSAVLASYFIDTAKLHAIAKNELSYCENWLRQSPHNSYAMSLLARQYALHKNAVIPADLVPDMLNGVDFLIKNNYYISAPELIEKLSSCKLSPSQQWELLLKSAVFYCKYGSNDECREISDKIIHSASGPSAYIQLSYAFDQFAIKDKAIALLEQCTTRYPKYKEAYLLEGTIFANQGFYEKSIALWEQGLKIDKADERFMIDIENAKKLELP